MTGWLWLAANVVFTLYTASTAAGFADWAAVVALAVLDLLFLRVLLRGRR